MRAELEAMVETAARAICKEDGDCLCILDAECTCNIRSSLFAKYAIAALEAVTPTIETLLAEREREVREACAKVVSDFGDFNEWSPRAGLIAAIRESGK